MRWHELKPGTRVLMPNPVGMLPRRRKICAGIVIDCAKVNGLKLVCVWARNLEDKGMAGWREPGELKPARPRRI